MPNRFFLLIPILALIGIPAQAQPASARVTALGGADTAIQDAADLMGNPASWSSARRLRVGLSAAQLYGMPELRAASAHLMVPIAGLSIAAGASSFGFDLYRETGLVLGLARAFRPATHRSVHVGIRLRHALIRIPGYAGASSSTLSAGVVVPVLPCISLGASAENIYVLRASASSDAVRSLALGVSCSLGSGVLVATDLIKDVRSPATIRLGVEAHLAGVLALRAGLTTEPPRASAGIGFRMKHLTVDAAAEHHYALGWTPVFSVAFQW